MTKEFQELIIEIFDENNIDFNVVTFFQLVKEKKKRQKDLKKQKDVKRDKRKSLICSIEAVDIEEEYGDDWTLEDIISEEVGCYINDKLSTYEIFHYDNYPDEGSTEILYAKCGDKYYELEVHCDAEWVGDWSVRANVTGSASVKSVKEIKCKVLNEDEIQLI